jgi:CRP/FNR family cyclic AMP-dependent transcriptional regulator
MPVTNPLTRLPAIRPVSIFRGLTKVALLKVARVSAEVTYTPGSTVVREGDPGDSLCIITDGTVEVRHGESVVARMTSGDFFGELSLIDGEPRSATVVAIDEVVLLTLSSSEFDTLMTDPYFARAVLRSLAKRFRKLQDLQTPDDL